MQVKIADLGPLERGEVTQWTDALLAKKTGKDETVKDRLGGLIATMWRSDVQIESWNDREAPPGTYDALPPDSVERMVWLSSRRTNGKTYGYPPALSKKPSGPLFAEAPDLVVDGTVHPVEHVNGEATTPTIATPTLARLVKHAQRHGTEGIFESARLSDAEMVKLDAELKRIGGRKYTSHFKATGTADARRDLVAHLHANGATEDEMLQQTGMSPDTLRRYMNDIEDSVYSSGTPHG